MTVINTNISGLLGLNNLRLNNLGMRVSIERLSSGLRINKAADDPSGLAMAKGMEAQIGGIRVAIQNAEDGINLIHTADGALSETQDMILRMRDLAVRAANDAVLVTADRTRLYNEFSSLQTEIERKAHAVTFNTKMIFSGLSDEMTRPGLMLQIGPDNGANFQITIKIPHMYNLTALQLSSPVGSLISNTNNMNNIVSDYRAALGVQERRLYHVIDDLKAEDINISAAKSRIYDADMALEISEFTRLQILKQTGTAIIAQANSQPQSILQLLS